jgi:hypothetical protein
MKKVFLVLGLLTIGLSSCKKDYTCECEVTIDDQTLDEKIVVGDIKNATEDEAKSECQKQNYDKMVDIILPDTTYQSHQKASCNIK